MDLANKLFAGHFVGKGQTLGIRDQVRKILEPGEVWRRADKRLMEWQLL